MKRIIGQYNGSEEGALVIAIGAMHGNEPAGVKALEKLFKMLTDEPKRNPNFRFHGRLVGIIGNTRAYKQGKRFIEKDLNRQFPNERFDLKEKKETPQYIDLFNEDLELKELLQCIENEIVMHNPKKLIVLDLHTTSASGGVFTIVGEDAESFLIATELHAPVLTGFIKGLGGTSLHYFKTENMGIPTVALSFEAGQHEDAISVYRAVAWLVNALRAIGCVAEHDVESRHEEILRGYARNLPKVVQLIDSHKITNEDNFKMLPNFKNFQPVKKGEILATDKKGDITAPEDCLILMPLYQPQGSDGFFLVRAIS